MNFFKKKRNLIFAITLFVSALRISAQFIHPGCLHTQKDFDRIEKQINNNSNAQVAKAWNAFSKNWILDIHGNWLSAITGDYLDRGGSLNNFAHCERDFGMCYVKALYWKLGHNSSDAAVKTRAELVAGEAVDLLNQYANRIKGISGNSNWALLAGFQGWQVANAAEILKDYSGWKTADLKKFKQWVYDIWFDRNQYYLCTQFGQCDSHGMSNWNASCISTTQAIGIFLDDPYIYNYAMMCLKQGTTNASLAEGVCGSAPTGNSWKGFLPYFWNVDSVNNAEGTNYQAPLGYLCQNQENTRDQGHSQMCLGIQEQTCEQAWNQGDDLWDFNDRIMAGGIEYTAGWCGADNDDSTFMKKYPYGRWWTDCGLSETNQPNISYASRENKVSVYQLGYNHFANRMGLNMPYAKKLHQKVCDTWSEGVEWGAGANQGQGWSDIAGFGDLMHNEDSATVKPTLLRAVITMIKGSTQSTRLTEVTGTTVNAITDGYTYMFPELSNIAKGSIVKLQPTIIDGSTDTGNWEWDDDTSIKTRERTVVVDTSKIIRVRYTNASGVVTTQMFCLHREGDGFKPTVKPYYIYDGNTMNDDTIVTTKKGSNITLGLHFTAGRNNRSVVWEKQTTTASTWTNITATSGDDYSSALQIYNMVTAANFRVTMTTKAGIVFRYTFHITLSEVDPFIIVKSDTLSTTCAAVLKGSNVKLFAMPNTVLSKATSMKRIYRWISDNDTLKIDTLTFHYAPDGTTKIANLSDTICLEQMDTCKNIQLDFNRISASGTISDHTIFNFSIPVYTKNDVAGGYYYIIDPSTGYYLNNTDVSFTSYNSDNDDAYQWRLRQMDAGHDYRYLILNKLSTKHLDNTGDYALTTNYNTQTFDILHKVSDENLYAIRNSENSDSLFWIISSDTLSKNLSLCKSFPFQLLNVNDVNTGIGENVMDNKSASESSMLTWSLHDRTFHVNAMTDGTLRFYNICGIREAQYNCKVGYQTITVDAHVNSFVVMVFTSTDGKQKIYKLLLPNK